MHRAVMIQISDSPHLNFSFWGFRPCTDFSDAVCEPYDWLIHGTGKAPFLIWMVDFGFEERQKILGVFL